MRSFNSSSTPSLKRKEEEQRIEELHPRINEQRRLICDTNLAKMTAKSKSWIYVDFEFFSELQGIEISKNENCNDSFFNF